MKSKLLAIIFTSVFIFIVCLKLIYLLLITIFILPFIEILRLLIFLLIVLICYLKENFYFLQLYLLFYFTTQLLTFFILNVNVYNLSILFKIATYTINIQVASSIYLYANINNLVFSLFTYSNHHTLIICCPHIINLNYFDADYDSIIYENNYYSKVNNSNKVIIIRIKSNLIIKYYLHSMLVVNK